MKSRSPVIALIALTAVIVLVAGSRGMRASGEATEPAFVPQANLESDTNRPGGDYRNFELSQADPNICRNECQSDSTCRSFTYVKPGLQGPKAHCWLKSEVPAASANTCCVSGVKSAGGGNSGLEVNVNRIGSDYRDYELADNNPNRCHDDCMADARCQSFTFLRPSYRGPNAHCFLKDSIPAASQNTCCISGTKAGGGGGCGSQYTMNAPSSIDRNQQLNVGFTAPSNHDPKGWIGIYLAGATPGKDGYSAWSYVGHDHECSGSVAVAGVPPGQYVVYYFLDGTYTNIGPRSSLTVR
jgi:hypothetical protein